MTIDEARAPLIRTAGRRIFSRLHRIERELRKVQKAPVCHAALEQELRRLIDQLEIDHERLHALIYQPSDAHERI